MHRLKNNGEKPRPRHKESSRSHQKPFTSREFTLDEVREWGKYLYVLMSALDDDNQLAGALKTSQQEGKILGFRVNEELYLEIQEDNFGYLKSLATCRTTLYDHTREFDILANKDHITLRYKSNFQVHICSVNSNWRIKNAPIRSNEWFPGNGFTITDGKVVPIERTGVYDLPSISNGSPDQDTLNYYQQKPKNALTPASSFEHLRQVSSDDESNFSLISDGAEGARSHIGDGELLQVPKQNPIRYKSLGLSRTLRSHFQVDGNPFFPQQRQTDRTQF